MQVGIGLPNAVPGVERSGIVEWARRAEQAGFSSLGTIDRLVYPNFESLVALAAAAAVTNISAFESAGADQVICFPTSPDLGQVELLARAALG